MARSIDDLLSQPVIKNTLEQILGRELTPQAKDVINKRSAGGVPYSLQEHPEQEEQYDALDTNSVPVSLRANPGPPVVPEESPEAPSDQEYSEEPPKKIPSIAATSAGDKESPQSNSAQEVANLLNFGASNKNGINEAIEAQHQAIRDAQLKRGFEQLAGGIAKVNPNTSDSDEMMKQVGLPVQEFQMRQQQEAHDPNSGISQGLRSYMQKLGVNVSEGATAAQIQQVLPFVFKDIEAKQAQAAKSQDMAERLKERESEAKYRNEALKLQKQQMHDSRDQAREDKMAKTDTDRLDKMSKAITAEVASSRSAFGQAARNFQSIQNAQALLHGEVDPNELDNRQVYELAKVLDRVLSQSGATIGGTEHLTPDTARGWLAKQMEYYTNKRQGAHAGDFIKTFAQTLDRESDIANKQMQRTQKSILSSYKDLKDKYPERFNEILSQHSIPTSMEHSSLDDQSTSSPAGMVLPSDARQKALDELKRRGLLK